jgi:hypothetical protein
MYQFSVLKRVSLWGLFLETRITNDEALTQPSPDSQQLRKGTTGFILRGRSSLYVPKAKLRTQVP